MHKWKLALAVLAIALFALGTRFDQSGWSSIAG